MDKRKAFHVRFNEAEYKDFQEKINLIEKANLKSTYKHIFFTGLNKLYKQAKQFIDSK